MNGKRTWKEAVAPCSRGYRNIWLGGLRKITLLSNSSLSNHSTVRLLLSAATDSWTTLRGFTPQANYADRATAAYRRS
jgi:hypothetical protein